MNNFGTQIRKLRENKKLTLRALAEQSNLSFSFIASLEKGRYNPSRDSIYSLAKPLEADVNELLMLAGFLPNKSEIKEEYRISHSHNIPNPYESFALESIMEIPVTFQSTKLKDADKIALIAFLQTMLEMKKHE